MYFDNPLTDHNLLQAVARTNRTYGAHKDHGLIVDYIGVSRKVEEALAAYRREDVADGGEIELAEADRAERPPSQAPAPTLLGIVSLGGPGR